MIYAYWDGLRPFFRNFEIFVAEDVYIFLGR